MVPKNAAQLSTQALRDVLILQQRELQQRLAQPYIPRLIAHTQAPADDLIRVILGPRRAGKSFFGIHWLRQLGPFAYLNLDDERLPGLTDFNAVLPILDELYHGVRHLLIDEVQNLPGWELLANRLQRQGYKLFLTGSNAHLLSRELATHLTGRHVPLLIFPFSFAEYLSTRQPTPTSAELLAHCRQYAQSGGFPEPLLKQLVGPDYLLTLLRSILYKDILRRFDLRHPRGLDNLAVCLLSNIGSEYSLNRLTDVADSRSVHTVDKYVRAMEEAFLIFSLPRFSWKVREQARSNKKVYAIDNGMATMAGFRFSSGIGRLYENLVAIELHRRELQGEHRVFFWKNPQQEEVDFVVQRGTAVTQLIQVCADMTDPRTAQREVRALLKAARELRCTELLVLTEDREGVEQASWMDLSGQVRYLPLWKWLSQSA